MAKWPRVYNACEKTGTRTLTSSQQPATLAPGNLIPSSGLFLYLHSHESTHVHAPQHSYLYIFKQEKSKCVIVFNKQPRQIIFPFFFLNYVQIPPKDLNHLQVSMETHSLPALLGNPQPLPSLPQVPASHGAANP